MGRRSVLILLVYGVGKIIAQGYMGLVVFIILSGGDAYAS